MKVFHLISIFPHFFDSYLSHSLVAKALKQNLFQVHVHDLRSFSLDKHKRVDDIPYGGGPGMVFKPEPLQAAIAHAKTISPQAKVIYFSCQGSVLNQDYVKNSYESLESYILICGRYEGIDQRIIDLYVDEELCIGSYVLAGGELPASVFLDALIRLIPGVMGKEISLKEESFEENLLEYPYYTRPEVFEGLKVPEVLLSGNHAEIQKWKKAQSLALTQLKRPDLFDKKK